MGFFVSLQGWGSLRRLKNLNASPRMEHEDGVSDFISTLAVAAGMIAGMEKLRHLLNLCFHVPEK